MVFSGCEHQWIYFTLQVLLTLPPAARQDYFPLLSEPLLMLEQLLMNLKVDWADMAVRTLKSLLVGQEAGFGSEDIDNLLAEYACKALDFSCAPRERTRSGQCAGVRGPGSCSLSHLMLFSFSCRKNFNSPTFVASLSYIITHCNAFQLVWHGLEPRTALLHVPHQLHHQVTGQILGTVGWFW